MKKINITDKIGTAITYKGCVTIEYFDKISGKKVINAYNEGQTALFNAIVKMLEGRDINNIVRPAQIDLLTSEGSVLSGPVPYVVNPILYVATKEGDKYYDREAPSGRNEADIVNNLGIIVPSAPASELGQILEYKEVPVNRIGADGLPLTDQFGTMVMQKNISYLTLNESLLYALKYLSSVKDENDINEKYYFYKRIMPQDSQFGDYLMKVDMERAALEAKEKIKNKIYSANVTDLVIVNSLYKSFSEMGYDFDRSDFDLSKEDYYKQAENILNARKEDNIRQAKAILAENEGLNLTSDEMVKRKEDLLKQISLLELDGDELIQLYGSETLDEAAEELKVQKTDATVRELASKVDEAEKELAERINNSAPAYCSSYLE